MVLLATLKVPEKFEIFVTTLFLMSVVLTARILSPILSFPVAAADPPAMILLT